MAQSSARGLALAALREWRSGYRFADATLQELLSASGFAAPDRAFVTELFYGTLRNLSLLDFWIGLLRSGSIDDESRDLFRLGLYQTFFLQTPEHAAVFETVELAGRRNRSLINGVLRSAIRRRSELQQAGEAAPLAVRTSHPAFLIERWSRAFGAEAAAALCDWNNRSALNYARINLLRTSLEDFLSQHPEAQLIPTHPHFVRLPTIPLDALKRGDCYIQDPSTSAAVGLLAPLPGERVLDACAAPGGKSGYIAALMQNRGELVACDRDAARLTKLAENLERLGVSIAQIVQADWQHQPTPSSISAGSFDRILVDVPCSNTGVLRRRVDARWRLRDEDFQRMPAEQMRILRNVVPLLRPGGTLVYSTCSIEPEENKRVSTRVIQEFPFLRQEADATILPHRDRFDGAFAAKLLHAGS